MLRGDDTQMTRTVHLSPHFVFVGCLKLTKKMSVDLNGYRRPCEPMALRKATSKLCSHFALHYLTKAHSGVPPNKGGCVLCWFLTRL